jgi:hypothetical protein
MNLNAFIKRAFTRPAPDAAAEEELTRLFARIGDNDPCLLAVRELLARRLLYHASLAGALNQDDTQKLRACERLDETRYLLAEIENGLAQGREWLAKQSR